MLLHSSLLYHLLVDEFLGDEFQLKPHFFVFHSLLIGALFPPFFGARFFLRALLCQSLHRSRTLNSEEFHAKCGILDVCLCLYGFGFVLETQSSLRGGHLLQQQLLLHSFLAPTQNKRGQAFFGLSCSAKCCIPLGYSAEGRPIYGRFLFEWPKVPWIYERVSSVGGVLSNTMKETLNA